MHRELPKEFLSAIQNKLGKETDRFIESMDENPTIAIRKNLSKLTHLTDEEIVPWAPHAHYLKERPNFTLDPLFHAGAYYVQEASSMFLYHVLKSLIPKPEQNMKILDLCASPGGKTTTILDYMKGNGLLVANEVIQSRIFPLIDNVIKWGYDNVVVTNNDGSTFGKKLPGFFDVIVVDAPCSGEGMFRKSENAIRDWNLENVELCSSRQRRILGDAISSLNRNGYLIYSTCTYNDEENIRNVEWLCNNFGLESIPIDSPKEWGIETIKLNDVSGYQFYPHKLKGEGYFISVLKSSQEREVGKMAQHSSLKVLDKNQRKVVEQWIDDSSNCYSTSKGEVYKYNESVYYHIHQLLQHTKVRYSGVKLGQVNKNIFIPNHALALENQGIYTGDSVLLEYEDAIGYLRKDLSKIDGSPKGWLKVTYQNMGIGWLKNLGNRINNYLPKEMRIKNL